MLRSVVCRLALGLGACLACACTSGKHSPAQDQGAGDLFAGDLLPGMNPQVLWLSYANGDEMDLVLVPNSEPPAF
jgi:hypothetical protein